MSVFYDLNKTPRNILNQAIVRAIVSENNGAWFDPSDLSTLYQDAAGTIPVTAVEQPVGLMLDKAQGMMLGPELVIGGDFSAGTAGFTSPYSATVSVIDGRLRVTATGTNPYAQKLLSSVVGKYYKVSIDIYAGTSSLSSPMQLAIASTSTPIGNSDLFLASSTGLTYKRYELIVLATTTTIAIRVRSGNTPIGTYFELDNVSVKELYGYHATQPITASRPTLSARYNMLLATETLATQSVTTLAAQYTLSFTGAGSVTLSGTATGALTGTGTDRVSLTFTPTAGTLTLTVSGGVTKAQLELGAVAGQYQRVNTATDYDTDERYFKKYLRFDGVDDHLVLTYMGLYANGSASVVGARDFVNTNAESDMFIAERNSVTGNAAYLPHIKSQASGNTSVFLRSDSNSVPIQVSSGAFTHDPVSVFSMVDTGNNIKHLANSVVQLNASYARGGVFTLNSTTIGSRNNAGVTGNFAKMNLYGLIITKSALTDSQRVACERYLGRKSGVQL